MVFLISFLELMNKENGATENPNPTTNIEDWTATVPVQGFVPTQFGQGAKTSCHSTEGTTPTLFARHPGMPLGHNSLVWNK